MVKIIYFLFSADHEIFFGENFKSEKELLIDTTYKLMDILRKYEIPLTLMTDVCSIFKYREIGLIDYPLLMEEQLKYAIKQGHDVQLHLHPHWLNSTYKNGKWNFDKDKFKLHDFGFEKDSNEVSANTIIKDGKKYLEKLLKQVDKDYKCIAFRAGGWCLQPERDLIKCLLDNEIYIDTSIYKGGYINTGTHYLDYRNVPNQVNWFIDYQKGLNTKGKEGIYEIPIGTINKKPYLYYQKVKNKQSRTKYLKVTTNGMPIGFKKQSFMEKLNARINNFINQPIMISFDNSTSIELMDYIEYYLNKLDYKNKDYYISIIGHPKGMNDSNLTEIDKFCKNVKEKYSDYIKFTDYLNVYNELLKK